MSRKTRPDKRSGVKKSGARHRLSAHLPTFDRRAKIVASVLVVSLIVGVAYARWPPSQTPEEAATETAAVAKNESPNPVRNLSTLSATELADIPPEAFRPRPRQAHGYNASQGGFPPGALPPGVVLPGITDGGRTMAQGYGVYDGVRQQFTGKERDSETGLDYFGARYYSATQGRFTSVDPENTGADPSNPQSWNGYAYALNNPVVYTDPDGLKVRVCGRDGTCAELSDEEANKGLFNKDYQKSIGGVVKGGKIYLNGELVGTYQRTSFDDWSDQANAVFFGTRDTAGLVNRAPVIERAVGAFAIVSVVGGVTGGVGLYALGPSATVTTLGLGTTTSATAAPSAVGTAFSQATLRAFQRQLAQHGRPALEKSLASFEKRLAEHLVKIEAARRAGGYTSSMVKEVKIFRESIAAIKHILGK